MGMTISIRGTDEDCTQMTYHTAVLLFEALGMECPDSDWDSGHWDAVEMAALIEQRQLALRRADPSGRALRIANTMLALAREAPDGKLYYFP